MGGKGSGVNAQQGMQEVIAGTNLPVAQFPADMSNLKDTFGEISKAMALGAGGGGVVGAKTDIVEDMSFFRGFSIDRPCVETDLRSFRNSLMPIDSNGRAREGVLRRQPIPMFSGGIRRVGHCVGYKFPHPP